MDKKKTGELIKEARMKKNYSQSELADLVGVSNKAVSRWENGNSFPDVGILENLATVLEVRIQDLITGNIERCDESVVAEIVRVAKLQQKEKDRNVISKGVLFITTLCCTILGYLALGNNYVFVANDSIILYVIFMVFSFVILVECTSRMGVDNNSTDKFGKCMKIISSLSLVWSILVTWCVFFMVINGHIPFGMELSSLGPFMNWQFIGLFLINLGIIVLELYRYDKRDVAIHWGWFVSIATMYMTILYSDMLHIMCPIQETIDSLAIRTLVVLVTVGISLIVSKRIKMKAN